jgi:hypothetical protein
VWRWASTTLSCKCCLADSDLDADHINVDFHVSHLFYTIPPAVLLTIVYAPLFRYIDVYKIAFLILVSFVQF